MKYLTIISTVYCIFSFCAYGMNENTDDLYEKLDHTTKAEIKTKLLESTDDSAQKTESNLFAREDANKKKSTYRIKTSFIEAFLNQRITIYSEERHITFPDYEDAGQTYARSWDWVRRFLKKEEQIVTVPWEASPIIYMNKSVSDFLDVPCDESCKQKLKFLAEKTPDMWYMISRVHLHQFLTGAASYVGKRGCKNPQIDFIDSEQMAREERVMSIFLPKMVRDMIKANEDLSEKEIIHNFIVRKHRIASNRLMWYNLFTQKNPPSKLPDDTSIYYSDIDIPYLGYRSLSDIRKMLKQKVKECFLRQISVSNGIVLIKNMEKSGNKKNSFNYYKKGCL